MFTYKSGNKVFYKNNKKEKLTNMYRWDMFYFLLLPVI
jgi:hypothetical protein